MTKQSTSIGPMAVTRITWSLEELTELVNDENSHVHFVKTRRHIALHPCQLVNVKQSLHDILGNEINYYDEKLNGLLLSYKNPKLLSENAAMLYDSFSCHVDIEADFYVFRPKVGYVLKGVINKKAGNHLGVLVHKVFNVSIPRKDDEEDWQGNYLNAEDEVTFTVELMDLKPGRGKLPFIRGKLVFSEHTDETSMVKTSKKYRFTDEDVNSDVSNNDEDSNENGEISKINMKKSNFSSTVNESNSSESEEEAAESPVQRQSQNIQLDSDCDGADDTVTEERIKSRLGGIQVESSDDSDDELPVFHTSIKREIPKRVLETKNIQQDSDNSDNESPISNKSMKKSSSPEKTPKKLVNEQQGSDDSDANVYFFNKSKNIEKDSSSVKLKKTVTDIKKDSTKRKIQLASSDDSDDEFPVFNKSINKEHPKKVSKPSKNIQPDSDESDDDSPIFNKSIKKSPSPEKTRKKLAKDSNDSDDDIPIFNTSKNVKNLKKDSKKKSINVRTATSDDSNDGVSIVDKSIEKSSYKKSPEKSSKRIKQGSDDSNEDLPIFNKSIKQESPKKSKRKQSESENGVSVDEQSKKIKKQSKKLKKLQQNPTRIHEEAKSNEENNELSESSSHLDDSKPRIIQEQALNHKNTKVEMAKNPVNPQKRRAKPAHVISGSEDSETENDRNKSIKVKNDSGIEKINLNQMERLSPENSDHETDNANNKANQNKISLIPESDDSDEDFASFMLGQKIEQDNDQKTQKIVKSAASAEESKSNDCQSNISSSKNSISLKKKSKKASVNAEVEDDSIQMLLHAERIKSEQEKSRENEIENGESSEVDISKKVKKEKKKTKKSKKSETPQEEDVNPETLVKIKKEKDKSGVVSVQSKKIVNLQVEDDSDLEFDNLTSQLRAREAENAELFPFVKNEKKGKRGRDSKREPEEPEMTEKKSKNITHMSPPPPKPQKVKTHKSSKSTISCPDENDELSDTSSTKSRILVKKEESVCFANIKTKQEPYASDVESISSRKRKRSDSERNDTFDAVRIKRESSVVKSEPNGKIEKSKMDKSLNDCSIKSEANASDLDDAPPKKKSKKKFTE